MVPCDSTALAVPVTLGKTSPKWVEVLSGAGRRPGDAEPRVTFNLTGSASASNDAMSHNSPADSKTTRVPSVLACRT
ncbi:hypothetical protein D3C73_1266200 [compost metagenome]